MSNLKMAILAKIFGDFSKIAKSFAYEGFGHFWENLEIFRSKISRFFENLRFSAKKWAILGVWTRSMQVIFKKWRIFLAIFQKNFWNFRNFKNGHFSAGSAKMAIFRGQKVGSGIFRFFPDLSVKMTRSLLIIFENLGFSGENGLKIHFFHFPRRSGKVGFLGHFWGCFQEKWEK